MILEDLMMLIKMADSKKLLPKMLTNTFKFKNDIRSLSSFAAQSTYYFPTLIPDNVTKDEAIMIMKALEREYASFTRLAFSLMPTMTVENEDMIEVKSYLDKFHQNQGLSTMQVGLNESAVKTFVGMSRMPIYKAYNETKLNDIPITKKARLSYARSLMEAASVIKDTAKLDPKRPKIDKSGFTDNDTKKANELVPTLVKASIGFLVGPTKQYVEQDMLVGIKSIAHNVSTTEMDENIVDAVAKNRTFFRFIQWFTGETNSLKDLLFGINELKLDVKRQSSGYSEWWSALKRRKRLATHVITFLS